MEGEEILDLRHWWLDRMLNGPAPLLEKMTLFWHGHFATSIQKVRDGYWMWFQNDTLRRNALGNFGTLVKKISRDPAMMIYLDLHQSRKEHPNENWARELMELFTVGIGNYTEQDIRESARAFTGYRIDLTTQQFRFAPFQQDHSPKKFMGHNGRPERRRNYRHAGLQAGLRPIHRPKNLAIFRRRRAVNKLSMQSPGRIRAHHFEMRPLLREIFSSGRILFRPGHGHQIKSPVQYIVQTSKLLGAQLPSAVAVQNAMRQMGQILFAPPNVKGWDGGKTVDQHINSVVPLQFRELSDQWRRHVLPNLETSARQAADVGFRRAAQYGRTNSTRSNRHQ